MSKGYNINVAGKGCVTPECRGSYVNILEARPLPQSDVLAWGMQCVFKKSPVVEQWVDDLKQVYAKVLMDKFGKEKAKDVAQAILNKNSFPVRDGDKPEDSAALSNSEQLKGCYFINTNNRFRQPHVIGAMGKPVPPSILTLDDVYSGAYYRVMLEFWYYDTAGNKGISTSLEAIMKTRDGENLGAGTSTSEASAAFSDFADEASGMFSENNTEDSVDDQSGNGAVSEGVGKKEPMEDFNFM